MERRDVVHKDIGQSYAIRSTPTTTASKRVSSTNNNATTVSSTQGEIRQTNLPPMVSHGHDLPIPREVELTDLGTRLKMMGKIEEGMAKYLEAISVNVVYAPAYYNIAVIYSELSRYEEALHYYHAAIQYNRFYVEAYCNIGVIYKNVGQLEAAITFYDKALSINPNFTIAKSNMAIALTDYGTYIKNQGKREEAIQYYQKALTYNVQYADAYYNLGVAYGESGHYDKAIVSYELAINFNPLCCEAYNNLGVIYKDRDNLERAIECYRSALSINAKFSQTLNNLGVVYTVQGKLDEAYAHVKGAIEVNPQYGEAYNNLGVLYRDEGEIKKAIACYDKCLSINANSRNASQNRLLAMNYLPDADLYEVFTSHKDWGKARAQRLYNSYRGPLTVGRCIRVGYISPDFFTHSVSYFIEAILANHDPTRFHITCYSNVVKEDAKSQRLKEMVSCWKSIYGKTAHEVAEMIHQDAIDIFVDLTGHTAGNRLDVLSLKPAPIQATYIGYPNTTGLPTIDYRFTDEITDPLDTTQQYVEKLIRLPRCFLCYTPAPDPIPVTAPPCLKNGFVTFGSFNNLAKINKHVIKLWACVLRQVPMSRLVVKCKPFASASIRTNFLNRLQAEGIDPSRVDLHALIPLNQDHLAAYGLMDISLDTFPYAGTTTTCESLWMGVPVVTLVGKSHAQNVGATILHQVGLSSLITYTKDEYVRVAVQLASNTKKIQEIRSSLRQMMQGSYLCNGPQFTQNLEKVYTEIWERYVITTSLANASTAGLSQATPTPTPASVADPAGSMSTPTSVQPQRKAEAPIASKPNGYSDTVHSQTVSHTPAKVHGSSASSSPGPTKRNKTGAISQREEEKVKVKEKEKVDDEDRQQQQQDDDEDEDEEHRHRHKLPNRHKESSSYSDIKDDDDDDEVVIIKEDKVRKKEEQEEEKERVFSSREEEDEEAMMLVMKMKRNPNVHHPSADDLKKKNNSDDDDGDDKEKDLKKKLKNDVNVNVNDEDDVQEKDAVVVVVEEMKRRRSPPNNNNGHDV